MTVRNLAKITPTNQPKPLSQEKGFFIPDILKETIMEKEAFHVSEFCQRYSVSKATFYREVIADRLRIIKRGRTTLIARVEAERWFEALSQK